MPQLTIHIIFIAKNVHLVDATNESKLYQVKRTKPIKNDMVIACIRTRTS